MLGTDEITNSEDIIDSRDVIARIEYLESFLEDDVLWEDVLDQSEIDELKDLCNLAQQGKDYAEDWQHGVALIRESHFEAYCKELVEEIDALPKDLPAYIADNISWEGVAEDLKVDYTEITFGDVTYYVR